MTGNEVAPAEVPRPKFRALAPSEFFERFVVASAGVQGIGTYGPTGKLTRVDWCREGEPNPAQKLAAWSGGRKPAYFTPSVFSPAVHLAGARESGETGKTKSNVTVSRAFWLDIEGVPGKGGYDNLSEATVNRPGFRGGPNS